MTLTAAVIGAGPDPDNPSGEGYAMGYRHADAYEAVDGVELLAVADIVPENARAFADEYGLGDDRVFEDYESMLDAVEPDVVSVTVPPALHADISLGCIRSGVVEAVHCEKPMSRTWAEARAMAEEADSHDVQLTFNHQRRFGEPFRRAKELLDDGEIGDLERVEFSAPNVYDYGSHSFDLCSFYNDEAEAEWVLASVDYREEDVLFGAHNENHAVVQWRYENGVTGLATTGVGAETVACHNRLVGSDGVIEVGPGGVAASEPSGSAATARAGSLSTATRSPRRRLHPACDRRRRRGRRNGRRLELCAQNALVGTELIFGAWESARRRGRVDFPWRSTTTPSNRWSNRAT
ncbi:Gfo/Idh/MocA family protein [Halosimplex aquaticum]